MILPRMEFSAGGWAWGAAVALAAASLWHASRTRAGKGLLALRLLAAAAVILALLNPAVDLRRGVLKKPGLLILVDVGHSMAASSGRGKASRLKEALDWLASNRGRIEAAASPRVLALSDGAQNVDWNETGSLSAGDAAFEPENALPQAQEMISAQSEPAKRVWLLSDGVTDEPPPKDVLSALGAPVDVLAAGRKPRGAGLSLMDVRPPDFAFLHQRFSISFSLKAWGLSGRRVTVFLYEEAGGAKSVPVAQATFTPNSAFALFTSSLTAAAQSLGGENFVIEAKTQGANAATGLASTKRIQVQVIRQKYRIMFLAGRPSPEYVFLREFLKSDPNREVVSFVILRNPGNMVPIPDNELSLIPFPENEIFMRDISQFDLFILENFSPARFYLPPAYLASIRNYVAKGGALLIIGGENAFNVGGYRGTPLEDLLPAKLSAAEPDFVPGLFHAEPVDYSHPMIDLYGGAAQSRAAWGALPDLDGYARLDSANPGTMVLAVDPKEKTDDGQPLPVVAVRPYGRGKVMMITTDSTWRWRLGGARNLATADFYQRFWSRAVEYLSGSLDLSKVQFVPLSRPLPDEEPLEVTLRVFDAQFRPAPDADTSVSITWTKPNKRRQILTPRAAGPGLYRVRLTGIPAGAQSLRASAFFRGKAWGTDRLKFFWSPGAAAPPLDRAWLKEAAKGGGGNYENLKDADAAKLLAKLPPPELIAETSRRLHPFAGPWFLALTGTLFALEIFLRRIRGMA
ncbi:MAG TPA: glutamine amidotransferase [Elusimicrobiota bacterium]|nr:glutamine amidotransferase [Elusimicrobiota bacterium]